MRSSGFIVAIGVVLLALVFATPHISVAGTTGKIVGRVTDAQSGEPLPGVNVVIEGTTMGAATDLEGRYMILNVPPGTYSLSASMIGYAKRTVTSVKVSIDLTTKVDFALEQEAIQLGEEVVIVAEQPIVRKDLTSVQANVSAERIANLPVQEFYEVLNIQSGVTVGPGGGIHIRGGRSSEIAYWIDGVPVSDVYDNSLSVEVENASIQELQVISGTFNAEYGQAMSGIINIVTKEGGERFEGNLNLYSGDYVTTDTDLFYNLDEVDPIANRNLQASVSGPIPGLGKKWSFFGTSRYYQTDGWLYGQRRFLTTGEPGDSSAVAMNWRKRFSGQVKLTYRFNPSMKINLGALGSKVDFRDYNHGFRWNPDGDVTKFDRGLNLSLLWTHAVSQRTFYTLNAARFFSGFKQRVFDDPKDPRYVNISDPRFSRGAFEFIRGGTSLHRFERNTTTLVAKFDLTSQVTRAHQVKTGFELRRHELFLDEINLVPQEDPVTGQPITPFQPKVPDISELNHDRYRERPIEFSAYVQDKIEMESMIVNIGLRFDYFDSRGRVLADPADPNIYNPFRPENAELSLAEREKVWYKKVDPKFRLSPRFGVAYPITDRGVIHFSYGHFLQIPSFLFLYNKPGFKVNEAGGLQGVFGNANLEPQKTVMYEIGLQQQLFENIGVDITGFYRDVRDWVSTSTPIETAIAGVSYVQYINRDYANVRGLTVSIDQRRTGFFAFNIAYTFQVAEGSNSNPEEEFFALQGNSEPTRQIIPLGWDQRHTLNAYFNFGSADWGVSLLGRFGSGLPYTPDIGFATRLGQNLSNALLKNSRRKPANFTFDLKLFRTLRTSRVRWTLFANVFNVFDQRNELNVFADTGTARKSLRETLPHDEGFFVRPDFYSEPREIQLGVQVAF
jgi:outer membrane receptor for ferrienterochelin and colicin